MAIINLTFNPNALRKGFEDTVGVMKTRATGAALEAMFQFLRMKSHTRATDLVCCRARAKILLLL
jgi:hypothetical protein